MKNENINQKLYNIKKRKNQNSHSYNLRLIYTLK